MKRIATGMIALALVMVGCGSNDGGDNGGGSNTEMLDQLITVFSSDGDIPLEVAECLADAAIKTLSKEDMAAALAGGDPTPEGAAAFTEAMTPCMELAKEG